MRDNLVRGQIVRRQIVRPPKWPSWSFCLPSHLVSKNYNSRSVLIKNCRFKISNLRSKRFGRCIMNEQIIRDKGCTCINTGQQIYICIIPHDFWFTFAFRPFSYSRVHKSQKSRNLSFYYCYCIFTSLEVIFSLTTFSFSYMKKNIISKRSLYNNLLWRI